MSRLKRIVLAAGLAATYAPAMAIDQNNEFRTLGVGAQTCADYAHARSAEDGDEWAPYGVWMTGFLTANNLMRRDTYDLLGTTTPERAMEVLDIYCSTNPDHPFVFAVMQLVSKELAPQKIDQKPNSAPAPIPIPSPDPPIR